MQLRVACGKVHCLTVNIPHFALYGAQPLVSGERRAHIYLDLSLQSLDTKSPPSTIILLPIRRSGRRQGLGHETQYRIRLPQEFQHFQDEKDRKESILMNSSVFLRSLSLTFH